MGGLVGGGVLSLFLIGALGGGGVKDDGVIKLWLRLRKRHTSGE